MRQTHQLDVVDGHTGVGQALLEGLAGDLVEALGGRHGLAAEFLHRADRRLGGDDERVLLVVTTECHEVRTGGHRVGHTRQRQLADLDLTGDGRGYQWVGVQQAELHVKAEVVAEEVHRPERSRERGVRESRTAHDHRLALDTGPDIGDRIRIHHRIVGLIGHCLGGGRRLGLLGRLRCRCLGIRGRLLIATAGNGEQCEPEHQGQQPLVFHPNSLR